MKLINITKTKRKTKYRDQDGNPIAFGDEYDYTAEIIPDTLALILDKKKTYSTIEYIRELIANIYNSNTYEVHLFSMIANADDEHQDLIYNILDSLKYQSTRFVVAEIAVKVLKTFKIQTKAQKLEEGN